MIVTFGDSTTAPREGVEVYTDQLTRRFLGARPELGFINQGVCGDTTAAARLRFDEAVLAARPEVVILQFGINDSAVDVWKNPPETKSRVSLAEYEGNLRFFVEQILAVGGHVILMTPNQLRWTPETKSLYGRPPYDADDERGFTHILLGYAEVVRRLAREYNLSLIDVFASYDLWEESRSVSCSELMLDGMHPNSDGQTLVADALEPLLRAHCQSL